MRPGKLLREQMRPDSPERIAWRLLDNDIRERAYEELRDAYPELTPTNAAEAMAYFERRRTEMHAEAQKGRAS